MLMLNMCAFSLLEFCHNCSKPCPGFNCGVTGEVRYKYNHLGFWGREFRGSPAFNEDIWMPDVGEYVY